MFFTQKKRIEHLRAIWGRRIDKYRNFDLIASYHTMAASPDDEQCVDPQTWGDLDFAAVFTRMDRNISGIGQQYLFHLLHKYEDDEQILEQRIHLVAALKADQD